MKKEAKEKWIYYNHALLPNCAPHITPIWNKKLWKNKWNGIPLLARWTSEFDSKEYKSWWYIIKDEPFDIQLLKSKRRNIINKGNKNFKINEINPIDYTKELLEVQIAAYSVYPEKYRPNIEKEEFINYLKLINKEIKINKKKMFGAFVRETDLLVGYILVGIYDEYIAFNVLKTNPEYEKMQVNAALVNGLLVAFENQLKLHKGFYICDGERSINHETNFQDYLEKYFGFRKVYCKMNICYRGYFSFIIKLLYPIKNILLKIDHIGFIHQVNAVLKMEQIIREQRLK